MATKPHMGPTGAGSPEFLPPSARELRAHAVHRLQIGVVGLVAMLLLIGLANIIMERARLADEQSVRVGAPVAVPEKTDPLADMGVVPSPDSGSAAADASAPAR